MLPVEHGPVLRVPRCSMVELGKTNWPGLQRQPVGPEEALNRANIHQFSHLLLARNTIYAQHRSMRYRSQTNVSVPTVGHIFFVRCSSLGRRSCPGFRASGRSCSGGGCRDQGGWTKRSVHRVEMGKTDGSCRTGICKISGGTSAGKSFHRFRRFDTRGKIKGVELDAIKRENSSLGSRDKGSPLIKSIGLNSSANLFWLSPGGIHLGQGASFVNAPTSP